MRRKLRSALLMAALVGAAACSRGLPPATNTPQMPTQGITATEATAAATSSAEASTAPTESALTPTAVPVKQWLVATDPTTVHLAAGRPQLVKVFAFW